MQYLGRAHLEVPFQGFDISNALIDITRVTLTECFDLLQNSPRRQERLFLELEGPIANPSHVSRDLSSERCIRLTHDSTIDGILEFPLQGLKSMLQLFHAVLWAGGMYDIADTYNATEKDGSKPHQVLRDNG